MRVPFFQKKPSEVQKSYVMITLSPMGQKAAENFDQNGTEFEILAALNQNRPQSIGALSKAAQVSFGECLKACKELKMKGYIQQVQRSE